MISSCMVMGQALSSRCHVGQRACIHTAISPWCRRCCGRCGTKKRQATFEKVACLLFVTTRLFSFVLLDVAQEYACVVLSPKNHGGLRSRPPRYGFPG